GAAPKAEFALKSHLSYYFGSLSSRPATVQSARADCEVESAAICWNLAISRPLAIQGLRPTDYRSPTQQAQEARRSCSPCTHIPPTSLRPAFHDTHDVTARLLTLRWPTYNRCRVINRVRRRVLQGRRRINGMEMNLWTPGPA